MLNVLPRTVKGVGEAFAIHENALVQFKSNMDAQKNHDRMAVKIGYVIMVRSFKWPQQQKTYGT